MRISSITFDFICISEENCYNNLAPSFFGFWDFLPIKFCELLAKWNFTTTNNLSPHATNNNIQVLNTYKVVLARKSDCSHSPSLNSAHPPFCWEKIFEYFRSYDEDMKFIFNINIMTTRNFPWFTMPLFNFQINPQRNLRKMAKKINFWEKNIWTTTTRQNIF